VPLRAFTCVDELPVFINGYRRCDFEERMFSPLHRSDAHRYVPRPGRGYIDHIDIGAVDHLFPNVFRAHIDRRSSARFLFASISGIRRPIGSHIADRHDVDELDVQAIVQVSHAPAKPDDCNAHAFKGRGGEFVNRLLAGRSGAGLANVW
jgi:hypothetical protein